MNNIGEIDVTEKARSDYVLGMKYIEISKKYNVPVNTLKSWKRRYKWTRNCTTKKGCNTKSISELEIVLRNEIRQDLITQLQSKEMYQKVNIDLVDDYMALWDIKNSLIADIRAKGTYIKWTNGKQSGEKKNESVAELLKVNTQMLKIRNELGINKSDKDDEDYDDI